MSIAAGMGDLAKDKYNLLMTLFGDQKTSSNASRFSRNRRTSKVGLNGTSGNTFPGNITTGAIGLINVPTGGSASIAAWQLFAVRSLADAAVSTHRTIGVQMIPDDQLTNFFASSRFRFRKASKPMPIDGFEERNQLQDSAGADFQRFHLRPRIRTSR